MNNIVEVLKAFESCKFVKGFTKAVIYDLQRYSYYEVPNSLIDFLKDGEGKSKLSIINQYPGIEKKYAQEYLNFLLDKEIVFFTDTPENYTPISDNFETPYLITNGIIDRDSNSSYSFQDVVSQFEKLKCEALEIRYFDNIGYNDLKKQLEFLEFMSFRSIDLILKHDESQPIKRFVNFINKNDIFNRILIHSKPDTIPEVKNQCWKISYTSANISNETHCGVINKENFIVNDLFFRESKTHNNCLAYKLSVDRFGNIKNCPSTSIIFGNVDSLSLEQSLSNKDFKKYWYINKDVISDCKICEYRYMCTDCRAYSLDSSDGNLNKPQKCNYDPFEGNWI